LIAEIGGVEPNERAAKAWLASLEVPWLLIIDNSDDPYLNIADLFPAGERGFILVTTRVPENTKHGTVGRKSFVFEQLESRAATHLLLKAAQVESPWDTKTMDGAGRITKALGYLPLALIHAGSAIANRLCELGSYLEYFETVWDNIRQTKKQTRARRPRHPDSDDSEDDQTYMGVYSSYEILYRRLERGAGEERTSRNRDAIDLLRIFSFFNRENIRLDLLIAAARNTVPKPVGKDDKPKPWTQRLRELTLRELLFALRIEVLKDRSQPVLPQMLRDVLDESITIPEFESRLRSGMKVLTQYSLITYQEATHSYAMHPLVHVWVRERPQMSLGEKAIWAQAAKNTITNSISLPLQGTPSKEELEFHRSLLLHIMNLRKRQSEIVAKIRKNQTRFFRIWPVVVPKSDLEVVDRNQALQCGKFSYVYTICGKWDEALALQQAVKDFLVPNLGWEHEASIRICKYLARTYLLKGRFNEAGTLNEQVLQAAINSLGEGHQITLEIMDNLGSIRVLQGRLPEAEEMHSRAIQGMRKTHGSDHPDTLSAIDNLGAVFWHKFEFDKAVECHLEALKGMKTKLGPTDERTLAAKENIAMAYREIGGAYLDEAHALMEEVLEERTKLLGREQPFTLIAMSNLAYVKHTMGDHEEAERIIRKGLPVGERNLGETHHGVLAAKLRLAIILTAQKRYEEAKAIFKFVLDRDKYADSVRTDGAIKGYHGSWIFAFYQYVLFWEHQGKVKEALDACEELCKVLESSTHRIRKIVFDKREDLTKRFAFPLL
jgi:tetratricopeptide (TPR) repeat protein